MKKEEIPAGYDEWLSLSIEAKYKIAQKSYFENLPNGTISDFHLMEIEHWEYELARDRSEKREWYDIKFVIEGRKLLAYYQKLEALNNVNELLESDGNGKRSNDKKYQSLKEIFINEAIVLSNNIKENEEKINHHGKRADAIVKSMLQHSRSSTGKKEPTNINALAEEYLRLAYHGLRAKDKLFDATTKTDFDESIGKINIVSQDIGRVVLNLINNAFYAVDEKKKEIGDGYEPTVEVSTVENNGKVEIKVADNGNGIPKKVLDKIFQPFFTTKPTGQGTGLGLSLSYDIVKAHGGEIKVNTREGEFTEFIVQLPISA